MKFLEAFEIGRRIKMSKNCSHVLIIDNDPFASRMMDLLLARDYRTRVVGELTGDIPPESFDSLSALHKARGTADGPDSFPPDADQPVDVILLNVENADRPGLPLLILDRLSSWPKPPRVLCTCTHPDAETARRIADQPCFAGYLAKSDVLYCIAAAVCLAVRGYTVITPAAALVLLNGRVALRDRERTLVVSLPPDTKKNRANAKLGTDIIRLKLILNLPLSEIQDELCTSEEYVAQVVSKKYADLQLGEIISGRVSLQELFASPYLDNGKIIHEYSKILQDQPALLERRKDKTRNPKFRNMDTLAFHLLTRPEIEKW